MKQNTIIRLITISVVLIFAAMIVFWNFYSPDSNIVIQNPGADNRPEGSARSADDVVIGEYFMRFSESSPTLQGQWSCFRGSDYANKVSFRAKAEVFKVEGSVDFPVVWKFETGEGYAAAAIYNGLVYVLDYDERLSSDMLRCFDLETGTELWRRWYRVPMKRNHGFSRTVPVVNEKYVVTIGPNGHVMCCDRITGDLKWTLDLQKQFETEIPHWYTGQCPRIENNQVILAPAGKEILMIGVEVETGEIAWQTPNTINYKMSHSSIMPMTLHEKKTFVYAGIGGICGVSAEHADKGKLLWNVTWQPSVIAPSPMQLSSDKILLTAGYGAGGATIQASYADGKWTATLIDRWRPNEGVSSEQQTPILYEQMVITIPPKDGGAVRGKVVAYSTSNLRTPIWESAADERFGLGPYLVVGNQLFAFKDDGELFVYQIGQRTMTLVGRQRILNGKDAWRPIAYADGYLILGDDRRVYALKISTE
jgi:outer membrane protein assembly factor BamB